MAAENSISKSMSAVPNSDSSAACPQSRQLLWIEPLGLKQCWALFTESHDTRILLRYIWLSLRAMPKLQGSCASIYQLAPGAGHNLSMPPGSTADARDVMAGSVLLPHCHRAVAACCNGLSKRMSALLFCSRPLDLPGPPRPMWIFNKVHVSVFIFSRLSQIPRLPIPGTSSPHHTPPLHSHCYSRRKGLRQAQPKSPSQGQIVTCLQGH